MKKRNKKHSTMKRLTRVSQYALKDMAIAFAAGPDAKAHFIDMRNGRLHRADEYMVHAASEIQHEWRCYIAVFLENQVGERYYRIGEASPERRCYQSDMAENLTQKHADLINETKRQDRVNVGWLAIPSGKDIGDDQAVKLIEKLDVWGAYDRGSISTEKDKQQDLRDQIAALEKIA